MTKTPSELLDQALALLARREHSRRELAGKLKGRAESERALSALLDDLQERGLQSDRRFAESLVRSCVSRGQGVLRIRQALLQKGIDSATIDEVLEETGEAQEEPGRDQAIAVRRKRFGDAPPSDRKEYARQARFLSYRGFTPEQVRYALDKAGEGGDGWD